jgi:hypothetical protein
VTTFHNLRVGILPPKTAQAANWRYFAWLPADDPEQYGHPLTQQQYEAAQAAVNWHQGNPPPHPIHNDVEAGVNQYDFGRIPRQNGLGAGQFRQRDLAFGGDNGTSYIETGYDVKIMWVKDPIPGLESLGQTEMHYNLVYDQAASCYEVRLWYALGQGFGSAPPYDTLAYMQECVLGGLYEAVTWIIDENHGAGTSEGNARAIFQGAGSYNTGRKRGRVQYAVTETLKELLFSGRQRDSQAARKLRPDQYRRFCDSFIAKAFYPGDAAKGEIIFDPSGLAEDYTAKTASFPLPPPPYWVPFDGAGDYQGPADYDYPRKGGTFASFNRQVGSSWLWVDGRRPPKPGSKVRFRVAWFPNSPTPEHGPAVFQLPTGRETEPGADLIDSGEYYVGVFGHPGVIWGFDWDGLKFRSFAYPPEIEHAHFPVIGFNMAAPGVWDVTFTVPNHFGTLGIVFQHDLPWSLIRVSGDDVNGHYGIRCEPGIQEWTRYPEKVKAEPYVPPTAYINAGVAGVGQRRIQHIVAGSLGQAIKMLDPYAEGYDIVIDNRESGNQPTGHPSPS